MGLALIAQSGADGQVRHCLPVVLEVEAEIDLVHSCERIAGGKRKLACSAARGANLRGRKSALKAEQGSAVTRQGSEGERAGVILHCLVVHMHAPCDAAPAKSMPSRRTRGEVLQFIAVLVIERIANRCASRSEGVENRKDGRVLSISLAGILLPKTEARLVYH